MEANNRAQFINSVAQGQAVPCPACGAKNSPENRFCIVCGAKMAVEPAKKAPAFAPAPASAGQPLVAGEVNPAEEAAGKVPAFAPAPAGAGRPPVASEVNPIEEAGSKAPAFVPAPASADQPPVVNEVKPAEEAASKAPIFASVPADEKLLEEEKSPFAEGLPSWEIVPPAIMVRRRSAK